MEVQKVAARLKPKVASFGFNEKELQGIAAKIANNLTSEDATDEDIDAQIDAAVPYLQVAQSVSNRVIEENRKKATPKKTEPAEDEDDEDGDSGKKSKKKDEAPDWFKEYVGKQEERFKALETAKAAETYTKKMTERFKDIDPEFYSIAAEGKSFENDDDFEAFATKIEEKWTAYSQKLANEGLSRRAKPKGKAEDPEEEFVAQMREINKQEK
jgi:hypothetical protein